ncbi:hypothetical protein FVE85_9543 [Porphyridium purpureum]|uniref:Uncharacterized protein n=1 Tax=Porphyridium purpureum TaxID=35688 RepID=A0A5J4YJ32_PORPP|nr:hypothetical protein FVE85_9543 [Porphyridium purpureum]|eukprot:POR0608..scf261_15
MRAALHDQIVQMKQRMSAMAAEHSRERQSWEQQAAAQIASLGAEAARQRVAPAPVLSSLKPAPMIYYGGERTAAALLKRKTAARDRVYLPAKTEWENAGRTWADEQEHQVVTTLATYFIEDTQS